MKKSLKIILIITVLITTLLLVFNATSAFAVISLSTNTAENTSVSNEENPTGGSTESASGSGNNSYSQQYGNEVDTGSNTPTPSNPSTSVSNLSSLPESELGLTNILSILLIAVGLILILLGVAVLIRLKK